MKNLYDKIFIPGKGYKGYCPVCSLAFYGKADKKYHYECKVAKNNQNAAERNGKIKTIISAIKKNEKILQKYYWSSEGQDGLEREVLIAAGLDFTLSTRQVYFSDGWVFYINNQYAYGFYNNRGKVKIVKTEELKQMESNNS